MTEGQVGDWYWHVHHDQLVEVLTEPLAFRIDYIRAYKPKEEIGTRLRLLKPASGVASALEQYKKVKASAWEQYEKVEAPALEQYKKVEAPALEQYKKVEASAWEQYENEVGRLHREQCPDCPWNGSTIFPEH